MPKDKDSAYLTLAGDLREAILRGHVDETKQLPTEAELVAKYGVSRQTVRRAFQDLVAAGMVYRVPGRGTFVPPRGVKHLRQVGGFESMVGLPESSALDLLVPLRLRINVEAAGRLSLESDLVMEISFRRLDGDVPFNVSHVYLPPAVGRRLAAFPELREPGHPRAITIIGLLEKDLGIRLVEAEQSISAVRADRDLSAQLNMEDGTIVMRTDRVYKDEDGNRVELATSYTNAASHPYRVRLRRNSVL